MYNAVHRLYFVCYLDDMKLNDLDKNLGTSTQPQLTGTGGGLYTSDQNNPVAMEIRVEEDEASQNICENVMVPPHLSDESLEIGSMSKSLEISVINKYFEDVANSAGYQVTPTGEMGARVVEFTQEHSNAISDSTISNTATTGIGDNSETAEATSLPSDNNSSNLIIVTTVSQDCKPASSMTLNSQAMYGEILDSAESDLTSDRLTLCQTESEKECLSDSGTVEKTNELRASETNNVDSLPTEEDHPNTASHILVTFSNEKKKSIGEKEAKGNELEISEEDRVTTKSSPSGNMSQSQQEALDKLIVDLEHASKNKDHQQQTQVLIIDDWLVAVSLFRLSGLVLVFIIIQLKLNNFF